MSDKKFLLKEFTSFEYLDEDVTKREEGKPLILKGILQKANTLNQNGRIYPKHILEREIRNYEKLIRENRAFGELDHCLDDQSEILTTSGWKPLADIAEAEEVYTLNTSTGMVEKEVIQEKITQRYDGQLIRLVGGRNIDVAMTPNHGVLLWDRYGLPQKISAETVFELFQENNSWLAHCHVKVSGLTTELDRGALSAESTMTIPETDHSMPVKVWAGLLGL